MAKKVKQETRVTGRSKLSQVKTLLKSLRVDGKLTLQQLADAAGLSPLTVWRVEKTGKLTRPVAVALSKGLNKPTLLAQLETIMGKAYPQQNIAIGKRGRARAAKDAAERTELKSIMLGFTDSSGRPMSVSVAGGTPDDVAKVVRGILVASSV